MKYCILLLLVFSFTSTLLHSQKYPYQIDSIHTYSILDGETTLKSRFLIFYEIGTNKGLRISRERLDWDETNKTWAKSGRSKEVYDSQKRRMFAEGYFFEDGEWIPSHRNEYRYGPNSRIDLTRFLQFQNNRFIPIQEIRNYYDRQGRLIQTTVSRPDSIPPEYQTTRKYYDHHGYNVIDSAFCYSGVFCSLVKQNVDPQGNPILRINESNILGNWYTNSDTWRYNDIGQLEFSEVISGYYRYGNRRYFFYNDDGNLEQIDGYSYSNGQVGNWTKSGTSEYKMNSDTNIFSDSTFNRNRTDTIQLFSIKHQYHTPSIPLDDIFIPEGLETVFHDEAQNYGRVEYQLTRYYQYPADTDTDSLVFFYGPSEVPLIQIDETAILVAYPNPAESSLFLKLGESNQKILGFVTIIDQTGRTVKEREWKYESPLDISQLQSGLYYVKLTIEGESISTKFIKR